MSEKKAYSNYFKKYIFPKEIITYLVNTDKTLKTTYESYQGIINSIKDKDFNKVKHIIHYPGIDISDKMKRAFKLYIDNKKYIENSFKYDINNGIIEGKNNLIKSIKIKA